MVLHTTTQAPIKWKAANKQDVRLQFGALCYRIVKDKPQILLVTSRDSGRWIIPKGWPMNGKTPSDAAMVEAYEEAGVKGRVFDYVIGMYGYDKRLEDLDRLHCVVSVFPMKVKRLLDEYPEAGERRRKWFSLKKAAKKVDERELGKILRRFDPRVLRR